MINIIPINTLGQSLWLSRCGLVAVLVGRFLCGIVGWLLYTYRCGLVALVCVACGSIAVDRSLCRSLWVGRCGSVAVSVAVGQSLCRSLWVGRRGFVALVCCGSVAVGWLLWVGCCGLVAVGQLLWVSHCGSVRSVAMGWSLVGGFVSVAVGRILW